MVGKVEFHHGDRTAVGAAAADTGKRFHRCLDEPGIELECFSWGNVVLVAGFKNIKFQRVGVQRGRVDRDITTIGRIRQWNDLLLAGEGNKWWGDERMVDRMEFQNSRCAAASPGVIKPREWINGCSDKSDIELECVERSNILHAAGIDIIEFWLVHL